MGFTENKIRVIAIAVIRKNRHILVMKCIDKVKGEIFYRPLGGGVEFGEEPEETVVREFKEELNVDIRVTKLLKVCNNVFTFDGKKGHEVVFLYEAEFVDKNNYNQEKFMQTLEDESEQDVVWYDLNSNEIIYPEKIKKYI